MHNDIIDDLEDNYNSINHRLKNCKEENQTFTHRMIIGAGALCVILIAARHWFSPAK